VFIVPSDNARVCNVDGEGVWRLVTKRAVALRFEIPGPR